MCIRDSSKILPLYSGTCAAKSNEVLSKFQASSWANVSCPSFFSTTDYKDGSTNITVFRALGESQVGAECCGSVDKLRCHDGSNMCQVSSDFNAAAMYGNSPCYSADAVAADKLGNLWTNVDCASTSSTFIGGTTTVAVWLQGAGATCCGSLAKTRCQTTATTTTTPVTTPPTPFKYQSKYWEGSQTCNPATTQPLDNAGPPLSLIHI